METHSPNHLKTRRSAQHSDERASSPEKQRVSSDEVDLVLTNQQDAMFRSSKSGKQLEPRLEPRFSDPLDQADSTALEWEGEPILNLVTAVLGAGVLGFPFCFKTCGLGLAVALVLVTLAAAELSMRLLLMSSQLTGKRSYEDLARHAYGKAGQLAVDSCIIAMNVGSVVAYLNILTDTISSVAGTVIPPGAEPSRNMMLGVVTMGGCLPVALFVKSAHLLNAVNAVSMVFLLFFCCIIALLPFSPTPYAGELVWWRWEGVLVAFPIVSYGFTAHQYLFQIYPASQRPSMKKMTTAVQRGMLLSAAIYVAVGACGYSAFGSRTSGDVLRNFGGVGASGVRLQAEKVLKYGFGVSLLGTIPLTVVPLHTTFAPWLAICSPAIQAAARQAEAAGLGTAGLQLSQLQESLLTAAILGASCAMAALLPNVEFVFGLAGSTASTLMAFILPAAIFLNVTSGQRGMLGLSVDMLRGSDVWRRRRRMAGALLLFGCVAGVLCTQALVLSIQEEAEVVQLAQELVREETKAAVAAHTEAKAKQVAEAVGAVVQAAKEVDAAQAEATGQAETLVRAAQALSGPNATATRKKKKEATAGLQLAHSGVDKAVQKLENVTATLGATASRMRNETATSKATAAGTTATPEAAGAAAAAGVSDAGILPEQQQQQQEHSLQPQQQSAAAQLQAEQQRSAQQDQRQAGGSEAVAAGSDGGSAAHSGVVRAAEAAVAMVHSAVRHGGQVPPGVQQGDASEADDEVAQALEMVVSTTNDTLTAVKQSKAALEAAAAEAATASRHKAQAGQLNKALSDAVNATTTAAARLNATSQALKAVEQQKTSELLTIVTKLAQEEEEEERQEARKQQYEQHTLGRKEGLGFTSSTAASSWGGAAAGGGGGEAAGNGTAMGTAGNATSASGKPRQEVREVLKQVAAAAAAAGTSGNVTAMNVTQMAQAAIEAASTVVASSKANMEQTIEKKKSEVAGRAIEIAKELSTKSSTRTAVTAAATATNSSSSSSSRSSIIDAAAVRHEEIRSRQSPPANSSTAAAAAAAGTGIAVPPPV